MFIVEHKEPLPDGGWQVVLSQPFRARQDAEEFAAQSHIAQGVVYPLRVQIPEGYAGMFAAPEFPRYRKEDDAYVDTLKPLSLDQAQAMASARESELRAQAYSQHDKESLPVFFDQIEAIPAADKAPYNRQWAVMSALPADQKGDAIKALYLLLAALPEGSKTDGFKELERL